MSFKIEWHGDDIVRLAQEKAAELVSKRAEQLERAMASATCPEHGGRPTIARVKTADGWSIKLAEPPCCAKLVEAVEEAKARELQRMKATS